MPRGCQASKNIALTRDDALATLRCVSITTAHNVVRQCSASFGKLVLVPVEAFEHVVSRHWHTGAVLLKFLAASSTLLCLSNVEMGGRNQDGNREKRRDGRGGTKVDSPLQHFLLQIAKVRKG